MTELRSTTLSSPDPAEVTVIVDALAASAASFVAQAGDRVLMTRNATMMIHDGSGMVIGNAKDMHNMGNVLDKLSDNIADIYSQRAGGTKAEWRAFMQEEIWYNAEEAVAANLADEVLDYSDDKADQAKNRWNLSLFNHASRDDAPSPDEVVKKLASITNRLKEAPVAGKPTPPKNTTPEGGTPPEGDTELAGSTGDGTPLVEGDQPLQTEPVTESGPGSEEQPPETTPAPEPVVNKTTGQVTFLINGLPVVDPRAIQNHIHVLETAATEAKVEGRKAFVASLAKDNKISASQIT